MWAYIIKRLLLMIPTLFGIVLITFVVLQMVPGGPVERMIAQFRAHTRGTEGGSVSVTGGSSLLRRSQLEREQVEYLKKLYGFDKPVHVQFFTWLVRLFTFDFGESYYRHQRWSQDRREPEESIRTLRSKQSAVCCWRKTRRTD